MKKALKRDGAPEAITTDGLRSYYAAKNELGNAENQEVGRWANTGWRTHTFHSDDASARCSGSGR
jgi:transposase-like protein